MRPEGFFLSSEAMAEPLLYRGCGLDGIYINNGYEVHEHDGEPHVSVKDIEGLHAVIGRHIAMNRKGLTPKEIRFLRNTMGITQADMAKRLGNNSQSVARWEKGESEIPGTAEKLLRILFIASLLTDDDLSTFKDLLNDRLGLLDDEDESITAPAQFQLLEHWMERDTKNAA